MVQYKRKDARTEDMLLALKVKYNEQEEAHY